MADYLLQGGVNPILLQGGVNTLLLNDGSPAPFSGAINVRARGEGGDGVGVIVVELRESSTIIATLVGALSSSFQTFSQILSAGQAANISNTANLQLWVTGSFSDTTPKQVVVSWLDFELPLASSSSTNISAPLISAVSSSLANTLATPSNLTAPAVNTTIALFGATPSSASPLGLTAPVINTTITTNANTLTTPANLTAPVINTTVAKNANTLTPPSNLIAPVVNTTITTNANTLTTPANLTAPVVSTTITTNANTLTTPANLTAPVVSTTITTNANTLTTPANLTAPVINTTVAKNANTLTTPSNLSAPLVSAAISLLGTTRTASGNVTTPSIAAAIQKLAPIVGNTRSIVATFISATGTLYAVVATSSVATSHLFYWTGTTWSPAIAKTWDGTGWVPDARVKAYSSASSAWLSTNLGV